MSQPKWYIRVHGRIHGPFDGHKLKLFVDAGTLTPEVEVATSHNGPWRQAATIRGLFVNSPLNNAESLPSTAPTRHPLPPLPEARPSQTVQAGGFLASLLDFVDWRPLAVAVFLTGVALLGFQASMVFVAERRPIAPDAAATAGSRQVKAGGKHVVFNAKHVMSHYNLDESDLTRIQVWNFGEIDLVEVEHQQNQRSGEVRDGKVVAKNAETEIRKPVKIPHLTPGVFVGSEPYGVWIDFGDIQVCFEDSVSLDRKYGGRETGVLADGERWSADALNNDDRFTASIRVRVGVADKDGRKESETWYCRFRDPRTNDKPGEFLVYKGGIRRDEKKVEELEERRASGRVVE